MLTIMTLASTMLAPALPPQGRQGMGRGNQAQAWTLLAKNHDTNKDGKITPAEYDRGAQKFATFDRNGDGVLTKADFAGAGGRGGNRRGGRRASPEMLLGMLMSRFVDKNADGKVTRKEWTWFLDGIPVEAGEPIFAVDLFEGDRMGRMLFGGLVQALDQNADRKLTMAELKTAFAKVDKDGNGALVAKEMPAMGGRGRRGGAGAGVPKVGELAPDFALPALENEKKIVRLSGFAGEKPVALIFGSYT